MRLPTAIKASLLLAFATVVFGASIRAADDPQNNLMTLLAAGKPAVGIWTGATAATRITKVLATSDADFIVADIEHDINDYRGLHSFLLEVFDFSSRYRTQARTAPAVLVKLAHRAGWDPRYEISETMRVGPATGVWVPQVESGAEMRRAISEFDQSEQTGLEGIRDSTSGGHTHVSPLWPLNPKGRLMVVAMIESEEGVKNAEEIISTPGLAAIHCVHISDADAQKVLQLCLKHKVIGAIDANASNVKAKIDAGWRMISLGWDFGMLQRQLGESIKSVRSAIGPTS